MTPIPITLPPGSEMSNYLYPGLTVDDLTQDMVAIRLPNGFYIDVGWYPEHDPKGRFVIRVFREYWDQQTLPAPITAKSVSELRFKLEDIAERYSRSQVTTLNSGSTAISVVMTRPKI